MGRFRLLYTGILAGVAEVLGLADDWLVVDDRVVEVTEVSVRNDESAVGSSDCRIGGALAAALALNWRTSAISTLVTRCLGGGCFLRERYLTFVFRSCLGLKGYSGKLEEFITASE
jgi:hypothetical protein